MNIYQIISNGVHRSWLPMYLGTSTKFLNAAFYLHLAAIIISCNVSYAQTDTSANYRKGYSFGFLGALNYPLAGTNDITYYLPKISQVSLRGLTGSNFGVSFKTSSSRKAAFQSDIIYSIERYKIEFGTEQVIVRLRSLNINPMLAINFTNNFSMMLGTIYFRSSSNDKLGINLSARYLMNNGISIGIKQNYFGRGRIIYNHYYNYYQDNVLINSFHLIIGYHFIRKMPYKKVKEQEKIIPALALQKDTSAEDISKLHSNIFNRAAPEIIITYPIIVNGKATTYKDEIPVAGKIIGNGDILQVVVNGERAEIGVNRTFEKNIKLDDGENIVVVKVTDAEGMVSKKIFSIIKEDLQKAASSELLSAGGVSHVLLFATDKYDHWNDLSNPVNDAKAIAEELHNYYGFQAELVENPALEQILMGLRKYAEKGYEPNDILFIFFAGHGQFDDVFKEGYVVAKDSRSGDKTKHSYIAHSNLRNIINNIPCEHIFLVMDVCYGGTFDPVIAASNRGADVYGEATRTEFIQRKLKYKTRRYLTSGGKEYVPDGRPGYHSPFARQFLEALRSYGGKDGILTINEILGYVEKVNPQPRAGEFGSNEPGSDFIFIAK